MRSLTALVAVMGWMLIGTPPAARAQDPADDQIKAAFLLNVMRYVNWPAEERTPPFRLCLLRHNPFGRRLEAIVSGERWQGGAINVQVVPTLRRAADCHLLYVPANASGRFAREFARVAGRPLLTVGEDDAFLRRGGVIRLFVEHRRVRFSINQKNAESSGLQISSRLLRLARDVVGAPGP